MRPAAGWFPDVFFRIQYLSHTRDEAGQEDLRLGVGAVPSSRLAHALQAVPVYAERQGRGQGDGGQRQGHAFEEAFCLAGETR